MQLSDLENQVRLDLFDPLGSNQRWSQSDIDRAIDKALDRYSAYYPNIVYSDMPTQPWQRTYPYPVSWNASYPVWWIERILYPLQLPGSSFAPPGGLLLASAVAGSGLSVGSYQYAVSFLTPGGETTPSPLTSVAVASGSQSVNLSAIPLAPVAAATQNYTNIVIGRNLYRSSAGGSTLYLLATLADNTTTSYTDSLSDSTLLTMPQAPTVNTSGIPCWPPRERSFSEFSNLFDSTVALGVGGNQGRQGMVGGSAGFTGMQSPSFTLQLSTDELPHDNTRVLRIFYATKHQLDSNGSTIPEMHRDIIALGASAYAMQAYQVPTNDNFLFQDGSLHDRVDDTHIPSAWMTVAQQRMEQFLTRLQEIKLQRDYSSAARLHWGTIPRRWAFV